jgi:REP element-mobilizing transposase RayT
MPDRPAGYVHRTKGLQPRDEVMAERYRGRQRESMVQFSAEMQAAMLEELTRAAPLQRCDLHGVAMEVTHLHVLVSWRDERAWKSLRASLRSSLTRMLNREFGKRSWFADSPSRKRVIDRGHFDHLIAKYLPKHRGVVWMARRS